MSVEWQENLSIGVLEIDIQHKILFGKFNSFLTAHQANTESAEGLYSLFWFLEAYAMTHFKDEEKLMQQVSFPDYLRHRELHQSFAEEIGRLKERLQKEGATQSLVSTMTTFITGWLVNHISTMDRAIGQFVNDKNNGN